MRKLNKKLLALLLTGYGCLVFLLASTGNVYGVEPEFKGYIENRLYMTLLNNDFTPSKYKNNLRWGDYNRARVEMNADVSEQSYINLTVDHFIYKGFLLQSFRKSGSGADPAKAAEEQKISIDRAYLKLYFKKADITIGQQRVSWGQSLMWSPFDVFNRVNVFEPQEEKSGVNAVRVQIPLGMTSAFDFVFTPETTLDESRAGARIIWNIFNSEFTVSGVHNVITTFSQNIGGLGVKTDLLFGLWFEGAFFDERSLPGEMAAEKDYFRYLAGIDYSFNVFNQKLYLMAEYTHDESGVSDKSAYNFTRAQSEGRSFLAKDYFYASAQLTRNDFTSLNFAVFRNINDGGTYIMPGITHSLFPNTELRFGMYLPVAREGTEFNPSRIYDLLNYAGNTTVYCWFRLYM